MKHIEQIQPEVAAYDLERIFREEGDAIATAALTALLHNVTGCDIPVTDDTPKSEVEELVPLAVSILRRHWTTPITALGDGTTPMSLADLMRRLIGDRVQGNEAMCIPPVHDNIPAAVSALRERKIGGVPDAPDGVSLPHLLCDSSIADTITELKDDNEGWVANKSFFTDKLASLFANLSTVTINCKEITTNPYEVDYWGDQLYPNYSIIYGEGVERIYTGYAINKKYTDTFVLPKVKTIVPFKTTISGYTNVSTPVLSRAKNILAPELEEWCLGTYNACGIQGDELRKFYAPKLKGISRLYGDEANGFVDACPKLIHLEVGEGFVGWYGWEGYSTSRQLSSVNFKKWEATMALRTDTDADDYVDLREDMSLSNNLEQFLSNFKAYIANRLTDKGSGKTLTLSQEVRDAIHSAGIDTIITNKGWTISPVPTQQ